MPQPPRFVKFVRTQNGVQSFVEKPDLGLVPHKLYTTEAEAIEAAAKAQAAGWNVVQTQGSRFAQPGIEGKSLSQPFLRAAFGDDRFYDKLYANPQLEQKFYSSFSPDDWDLIGKIQQLKPQQIAQLKAGQFDPGLMEDVFSNLGGIQNHAMDVYPLDMPETLIGLRRRLSGKKQPNVQTQALNNQIRTPQGLNTEATRSLNSIQEAGHLPPTANNLPPSAIPNQIATENWGAQQAAKINPEIGSPEMEMFWGTIARKPAYYTRADLSNPKYGAAPPAAKNFIGLQDSLDNLDEWQRYGIRQGTLGDFMNRSDRAYGVDRTSALGERQILTSDQNYILNSYRQELGEYAPNFVKPEQTYYVENTHPNYTAIYNHLASQHPHLNLAEKIDKAFLGGHVLDTAPTLKVVIPGTQPKGMRALAPESDSYSMAPQSAYSQEPPRNLLRFPTYQETPIQPYKQHSFSDQIADYLQNFNKKRQLKNWYNREPDYRSGQPLLKRDDPRVQEAILKDRLARESYQAEIASGLNSRQGSYNLVVQPNEYQILKEEGLLPTAPSEAIKGLYLDGKPYFPSNYHIDNRTFPTGLKLEVEGITANGTARFPITGGARIDKTVLSEVDSDWDKDETGKHHFAVRKGEKVKRYSLATDSIVRNPDEPMMMDAYEAINAKRKITDLASARFLNAMDDPNSNPNQVLAYQKQYETHRQQLAKAERAYAALSRLEPVPSKNEVKVSLTTNNADDAINLLRSHGLEVISQNPNQVIAQGQIPIETQMKLNSELASRFNREQVVMPPDVSIASSLPAFKQAGIAPNTFVKGVKWKGDKIVDPGTPIGTWERQRVVRGNVTEPTVQQVSTQVLEPVYESDPQMQSLIAARDNAKRNQTNKLIEAVNIKRAERGEPLLAVGNNGQLFHLPHDSISVAEPETIDQIVFSAAARKQQPFSDEAAAVLNQALHNASVRQSRQNITQAIGTAMLAPKRGNALTAKLLREAQAANPNLEYELSKPINAPSVDINSTGLTQRLARPGLPAYNSGSKFDLSAIAREAMPERFPPFQPPASEMSYASHTPVVLPATVDVSAVNRSQEFERLRAREQMARNYEARMQQERELLHNWNPPITVPATAVPEVREIPIDWQEQEWQPTPRPQPTPTPAPVIIEDPAVRGFERYIPAATALGALGLGAGVGYAMAPRSSKEEEQMRQQQMLMQQQLMLQRMQGRSHGW
jgi:hypothetical protein